MASTLRVGASCATAVLALLVASAPAAGASKRITGKLSKPGLTVIALSKSGRASLDRPKQRKFSVRARAEVVTLHLRAADGTYAGPIVVAKRDQGRRAIVGVAAGASLGVVKVNSARGFAKVARRLPPRLLDTEWQARARRGRPLGHGRNFGRVKVKRTRDPAPGDRDSDGVPNQLDIDDDGDLILDKVDRGGRGRARAAQGTNDFGLATVFAPGLMHNWTNANAGTLTDAEIDETLARQGYLIFELLAVGAELDCGGAPDPADPAGWIGGLSYCTRGGTGFGFGPGGSEFPECCDGDGDGFGTLPNNSPDFPDPGHFFFSHGATTSEIGTGDVLVQRVGETPFVSLLPFVFATVPALISYDDGRGNSATIDYPIPSPSPGSPPPPGSRENPFPVEARPNGDVRVTMTFWRPQRRPIPPESGDWIDMGGLIYNAKTHFTAQPSCSQQAFSENDPNLAPDSSLPDGGLIDLAADQPANPAHTFTLTLNLTECRRNHGASFDANEEITLSFHGWAYGGAQEGATRGQTDIAVSFQRQP